MRAFGRSCHGQRRVFVKLVRHTAHQLLELGEPIPTVGRQATERLEQATTLHETTRERLTQGKKLSHCKHVHAYDLTIAPMIKGQSHGPAQFGRKPGIASEPATGLLFAPLVPTGNPSDASSVLPLLAKVHEATRHVQRGPKRQMHAVAGDLGVNDPGVRQALHERGLLTVGIPRTIAPPPTHPSAQEVLDRLHEAGLHRIRTPHQVH
jgi:hypothetical protein